MKIALTCILPLVLLGVGCGKTSQVHGKVSLKDGTPLTSGRITFSSAEMSLSATGSIGSDGTYRLSTYGVNDGAPRGKYAVTVVASKNEDAPATEFMNDTRDRSAAVMKPAASEPQSMSLIHSRYADATSSQLTAEVVSGENAIDFTLDPP